MREEIKEITKETQEIIEETTLKETTEKALEEVSEVPEKAKEDTHKEVIQKDIKDNKLKFRFYYKQGSSDGSVYF